MSLVSIPGSEPGTQPGPRVAGPYVRAVLDRFGRHLSSKLVLEFAVPARLIGDVGVVWSCVGRLESWLGLEGGRAHFELRYRYAMVECY